MGRTQLGTPTVAGIVPAVEVFLEGIPVRVEGVTVQNLIGQPVITTLGLQATPAAYRIRPATTVQAFVQRPGRAEPDLLSEGLVISRGKVRTPTVRRLTLAAAGPMHWAGGIPAHYLLRGANLALVTTGVSGVETGVVAAEQVRLLTGFVEELLGGGEDLTRLLTGLLQRMVSTRPAGDFYARLAGRWRLADRVAGVASLAAANFTDREEMLRYLRQVLAGEWNAQHLLQLIQGLLALIRGTWLEHAAPPSRNGRIGSWSLIQQLPLQAPPRCNVIFPLDVQTEATQEDYGGRPTRLVMSGFGELDPHEPETAAPGTDFAAHPPGYQRLDVAPAALRQAVAAAADPRAALATTLTPLEQETGIVARYTRLPGDQFLGSKPYARALADFQFALAHLGGNTAQLALRFRPELVVGFPAMVWDGESDQVAFGVLTEVTHRVDVAHARAETAVVIQWLDRDGVAAGVPASALYADAYGAGAISDAVYQPVLGVSALTGATAGRAGAGQALGEAYRAAERRGEAIAFVDQTVDRPMVTRSEALAFWAATRRRDGVLDGPLYAKTPDAREPVGAYLEELGRMQALTETLTPTTEN